ncbi:MAG TPA: ABC transporter substrate-binding protein [Pyrinomonadaceae bacterium]|nr:ABC transporter substrate-binding protein [Pyrinomonadaceae bacterium]
MRSRVNKIKLLFLLCACLALAFFLFGKSSQTASAQAQADKLSAAEQRGKLIYLRGEDGTGPEITAMLGGGETEVPATTFACANCHGLTGEGTEEGGLTAPPLVWQALTKAHTSALTTKERGPYTDATLVRAVLDGLDPAGTRLHPGMPHYRMTNEQAADLVAYLKKLGSELDPGLSEGTIKIGAALPLSGPLAPLGQDIKNTLSASFAEANEQGGIYGRRFELVVEDSRGDLSGTHEATRKLIERDGVFALTGSFEPKGANDANEVLKRAEVPLVGPVTLSPHLTLPPNRFIFYLLPTFSDQARSLVDFIISQRKSDGQKVRAAVIYMKGELEEDALEGLRAQARLRSVDLVFEQRYEAGHFVPASTVAAMAGKKADYLFFFGNGADIAACAKEMDRARLKISLVSSVMMFGREAFELSPDMASRTFLSYPSALPDQNEFAEFLNIMQRRGVQLRSPAFQTVAYASARTLMEAVKLSSRRLSRAGLVGALEGLHDYRTGVIPPISFGPNRRVGVEGSFVVGIDLNNKRYVPLSEQLVPRDIP